MTAELSGIRGWKTWKYITTEDSSLPILNTNVDADHGGFESPINVHPYSAVAIRMFGSDTVGDTANLVILGSMDDQRKTGTGPMQKLWGGQVSLGSSPGTLSSGRPVNDGKWAALTLLEVDTYDVSVSGGYNLANAVALTGGDQALLILPTLGYAVLDMRLTAMDGTGTQISTLGAIYREIAMGGVV